MDHATYQTSEKLGYWCVFCCSLFYILDIQLTSRFPTILDTLILARSKVLLRNPHSTSECALSMSARTCVRRSKKADKAVSLLQGLRVETWNQGMSRTMDMHQKVPDDWEWDLQW